MREIFRPSRMWRRRGELKQSYDVVIIGGGAHGLATAYYLGQRGVKNVAIDFQEWPGHARHLREIKYEQKSRLGAFPRAPTPS